MTGVIATVTGSGTNVVGAMPTPAPVVVAAGIPGRRGSPGEPGPAGDSSVQRVAGETISALRVVYELDGEVFALDPTDEVHVDLVLGVARTSAMIGEAVNIQRSGPIDDSSWTWTPNPVYLGSNGALTQTPPATGFRVRIGASPEPTRLNIDISEPIDLG